MDIMFQEIQLLRNKVSFLNLHRIIFVEEIMTRLINCENGFHYFRPKIKISPVFVFEGRDTESCKSVSSGKGIKK